MTEQVENETKVEEPETEEVQETFESKVKGALSGFEGAPGTETIEGWKGQFGDVFVSAFSNDEIFIFRSLRRSEYVELQDALAMNEMTPVQQEDKTVNTCLLWTSVKDLSSKAGTIPTLLEQVLQNSNFVPPQLASQFVAKL